MHKLFFLLICLFASSLSAYELRAKAALSSTDGYYVLSDGSCWKVMACDCLPRDWELGDEIEVWRLVDLIGSFTHTLFNHYTGETLFGALLDPATFLVTVFNSAYQDGYQTGYDDGYYHLR